MNDFEFNAENLVDGKLFVGFVTVGEVAVEDSEGELVLTPQTATVQNGVSGVLIDLSEFGVGDEMWRIRYINADGSLVPDDSSSSADGGEDATGEYIHDYIKKIDSGNTAIDEIVNKMVYPQIWMFCEIPVYYETGMRRRDGSYKFSYEHWNRGFEPEVFLNGSDSQLASENYSVDFETGSVTPSFETTTGDNILCSYNFSWFTHETLASYVYRAIGTFNYAGQGATTSYTVDTLPESFYGIVADLCVAMAMENLILSEAVWKGKLWKAFSANGLYDGSGDLSSLFETIKHNAEDRAYKALENDKTRAPNAIARPTQAYWRAVTLGAGIRPGPHGQFGYGKTRGWKINRLAGGITGPDLGL